MADSDSALEQTSPAAEKSASGESQLARSLWRRHVEMRGVIPTHLSIRLARRAAPVYARLSSDPLRRLQRMASMEGDGPYPSLPLVRATFVSTEAAPPEVGLRPSDMKSAGTKSGRVRAQPAASSLPMVQTVHAEQQAAGGANAGVDIVRRHLSAPTERMIQRQAVASEQYHAQDHQALVHQPDVMLSRDSSGTTSNSWGEPAQVAGARRSITPPANSIPASPIAAAIQRQVAAGVSATPIALQSATDDTALPNVSRAVQTAKDAMPVINATAFPSNAALRAAARFDRTYLAQQTPPLLPRMAAHSRNEFQSAAHFAATLPVKPNEPRVFRAAERMGQDATAASERASTRPVSRADRSDASRVWPALTSPPGELLLARASKPAQGSVADMPSAQDTEHTAPEPVERQVHDNVDMHELAEQVSRILLRQWAVERERRGIGRWH